MTKQSPINSDRDIAAKTKRQFSLVKSKLPNEKIFTKPELYTIIPAKLSLGGQWNFSLDPENKGIDEKWFSKELPNQIKLPGTTDQGRFGEKSTLRPQLTKEVLHHLTREYSYVGAAWYQKQVVIPLQWKQKRIILSLERCLWETKIWLDNNKIGERESLSVPHLYDLSGFATPGEHTLTIQVDNSMKYNIGLMGHAYTDETQTIWNGIIGDIVLRATDKIWIDDVQVCPDPAAKKVKIDILLRNVLDCSANTVIGLKVNSYNSNRYKHSPEPKTVELNLQEPSRSISIDYYLGEDALCWDEFNPVLYKLDIRLMAKSEQIRCHDHKIVSFGLRQFQAEQTQLKINGRPVFLRGTLECCIFPLTGFPPMETEGWLRVFQIARSYGLNHLRFHSWCPPRVAFEAADLIGFYLQIELPNWTFNMGKELSRDAFLWSEANQILDAYGNHPSFCMMSLGNEIEGDFSFMQKLVRHLQHRDSRHLYTTTTFSFQNGHGKWPEPVDNFFITQETKKGWIRGQGFFNEIKPNTKFDFSSSLEGIDLPTISHEIGQYAIYPDLNEISKYTGALRPLNFEAVKLDLQKKNLLEQASDFTLASGKLAAILYKADIELALRSCGLSGFQLLDLHDFPGQSTALVGILNAFWDSKGLIEPDEFRRFCSPSVPLVRMKKLTWLNNETFEAKVEIAHFGPEPLKDAEPLWSIKDAQGREISSGTLEKRTIPLGKNISLGNVKMPLETVKRASRLIVTISIAGTDISNSWNIWVYPANQDIAIPNDVMVARTFDIEMKKALKQGKKILFLAESDVFCEKITNNVAKYPYCSGFAPVFWSPVHFPDQIGTMGILCDPNHPALAEFPTDFHTDWQWWDLLTKSFTMILNNIPQGLKPIVQVIDNFARNHKLGNIFEVTVGKDKLLVCSIDLERDLETRPAARQLKYSLLKYISSDNFQPQQSVPIELLESLLLNMYNNKRKDEK